MPRILVLLFAGSVLLPAAIVETYDLHWEIMTPTTGGGGQTIDGPSNMDFSATFGSATFRARGLLQLLDGSTPLTLGTPLTNALTFRFTDATIECTGTGSCGGVGIVMYVYPHFAGTQTAFRAIAGIDGTVSPQYTISWSAGAPGLGSDFSPITTTTFNRTTSTSVQLSFNSGEQRPQMFLTLAPFNMPAGTTISLPGSFWIQQDPSPAPGPIPEPSSALAVAGGLGLLALRRVAKIGKR
ncbi:MAG: PEP-CTERM sorting domain-containing protein [Bryobacteraceae bacterium]